MSSEAEKTQQTMLVAPNPVPAIYGALVAIGGELARVGITKDRVNPQQNFRFRGVDDVMNTVSPIFAKHGVIFLPTYFDYPDVERTTSKGATLIYTKVRGLFTFVSAEDGSTVTVTTFGVAMDSGDKACNKAMSAALKYALLQTFLIPTEGENDADAATPEPSVAKPEGFEAWFTDLVEVADHGTAALKRAWENSPKEMREFARVFRDGPWTEAKKWAGAVDKQNAAKVDDEELPEPELPPEPAPEVESKSRAKRLAARDQAKTR